MEYIRHVQYLQGTVTQVDPILFTYKFLTKDSKETTVFVAPCAAVNPTKLPQVTDEFVIKNAYLKPNYDCGYFMLHDSRLFVKKFSENRIYDYESNEFLQLIQLHKLTPEQIMTFHLFYKEVEFDCQENISKIKLVLLKHLIEHENILQSENLLVCKFTTPADCQYIIKQHVYEKFPYHGFMHGVHHGEKHEYLVGWLCVNQFGLFELWHGSACIHLKILADNNHRLLCYHNKFIIVARFTVFTELYEFGLNFDYAICNVDDVKVLNLTGNYGNKNVNVCDELPTGLQYEHVNTISIKNLCSPNSIETKQTEIWLDVWVLKDQTWVHQYLCVEQGLFNMLPYLNVGNIYNVHSKLAWTPYSDPEIKRAALTPRTYKIQGNEAYFVKNSSSLLPMTIPKSLLTLKEVNNLLKTFGSKKYIDFEAIIDLKVFTNNSIASRTKRQIMSQAYGTPGRRTHVLKFTPITDETVSCSLFLNNWERKLCPLGLLPYMKVVVRHAEVARNYLKSNGLTSFTVVGYECPIKFNTANLNLLSNNSRVFYSCLGDGHHMPVHVLVRTKARFKRIKNLSISCVDDTLKMNAIFITKDVKGDACVITQNTDFIKHMLPKSIPFEQWLEKFKQIGHFNIYDENLQNHASDEIRQLYEAVHNCLHLTLNGGLMYIDMLCRRLEAKELTDNSGVPLWFATEIIEMVL